MKNYLADQNVRETGMGTSCTRPHPRFASVLASDLPGQNADRAGRLSSGRAAGRHGVQSVPSGQRLCVHWMGGMEMGYLAALASSMSMPKPGWSLAHR